MWFPTTLNTRDSEASACFWFPPGCHFAAFFFPSPQRTEAPGQTAHSRSKPPAQTEKGWHAKEKVEQNGAAFVREVRRAQGCKYLWCMIRRWGGQVVCSTDQSVLQRDEGPPPDFVSAWWDRCSGEKPSSCCPEGSAKMLKWFFFFSLAKPQSKQKKTFWVQDDQSAHRQMMLSRLLPAVKEDKLTSSGGAPCCSLWAKCRFLIRTKGKSAAAPTACWTFFFI